VELKATSLTTSGLAREEEVELKATSLTTSGLAREEKWN
jgi:hypothetical protein